MSAARSTDASVGFPQHLVREDLRDFAGYSSARTSVTGDAAIWLNAFVLTAALIFVLLARSGRKIRAGAAGEPVLQGRTDC